MLMHQNSAFGFGQHPAALPQHSRPTVPLSPPLLRSSQRERIQRSDRCLLVRCIPASWDEWSVFHFFRKIGTVHNVYVPRPKEESMHSFVPHAYLEMMNEAELQKVLASCDYMARISLDGVAQMIEVRPYTPLVSADQVQRNIAVLLQMNAYKRISAASDDHSPLPPSPAVSTTRNNILNVFEALGISPTDTSASPKSSSAEEGKSSPLKPPPVAQLEKRIATRGRRNSFKSRSDGSIVYDKTVHRTDYLPLDRSLNDVDFVIPADGETSFFYVLDKKHVAQYDKRVVEQIRKAFATAANIEHLKENEIVLLKALSDENDPKAFVRAMHVAKVNDGGDHKMFLVDLGLTGVFNISAMRKISNDVARKPFLAMRCELYGLDGKQPLNELRELFAHSVASLQVRLIAFRGLNSLIQCYISWKKSNGSRTKLVDLAEFLAKRITGLNYSPPKNEKLVYTKEKIISVKNNLTSNSKTTIPIGFLSEMFADIFVGGA